MIDDETPKKAGLIYQNNKRGSKIKDVFAHLHLSLGSSGDLFTNTSFTFSFASSTFQTTNDITTAIFCRLSEHWDRINFLTAKLLTATEKV